MDSKAKVANKIKHQISKFSGIISKPFPTELPDQNPILFLTHSFAIKGLADSDRLVFLSYF